MKVIITEDQLKEIKNKLKESPDKVSDGNSVKATWSDLDSVSFGFANDRAYVSLNYALLMNSKNFDYKIKKKIDDLPHGFIKKMTMHDNICDFYAYYLNDNKVPCDRDDFEYPGRFWFDKKIISFWRYPDKDNLKILIGQLSKELYRVYNTKFNFNNYQIEIKSNEYSSDLDIDDDDYVDDFDWIRSLKNGVLIPINDFIGSVDAAPDEMANIHLLPSAEKQNTPQMQAVKNANIERNANKFKNTSQAEWNAARNKYRGESKEIKGELIEDINIPVNTGDTVLMGKFKNKKTLIKNIGKDEYNMPTINGKKAATFRMAEDEITNVRQGIIPYEGGVMGEANIGTEMKRAFIDWDSNYGKCFKVVSTPRGAESGGNWDKDLISIVTPENGDAWHKWVEVPFNILNNWKSNWGNIQKSLGDYKYNQILRCLQKMNEVLEKDVDLNSFEIKKELNPKIWVNKKLNSKVRKRLLKIADDFLDFINVDSKYCKDILFLGSLANYNWSKYSDIDLHLVVDFKKINSDVKLVKEYFDTKRKLWALEHESLKIYGFPVELYIQDVDETNFSTGEFSLEKNKWTKIPKEDQDDLINVNKIKQKAADIMTVIEDLKSKYDKKKSISDIEDISKKVKSIFDNIKKLRKSGLESKLGEFSVGNIVFKVLRRSGYMETLVDLKRSTYDKINTIK
jgi:hypothetical protein